MPLYSFIASLALHALFVSSFSMSPGNGEKDADRLVEISYVKYPEPRTELPAQIKYPSTAKKASAPKPSQASEKQAALLLVKPSEKTPGQDAAKISSFVVKNSEEFLSDPQKGKVFLAYFGQVKQRVQRSVRKNYSEQAAGRGDVTLMFELKADGALVKIYPLQSRSSADEPLKDFAVRCVKECSPFPRFPKELGMERIAFNISILFDET